MKFNFLLYTIVVIIFNGIIENIYSQTNIPRDHSTIVSGGPLEGIWTLDNSPYYIDGDSWISKDSKLEIQAGVKIIFNNNYRFDVYGQLLAESTAEEMIHFTAKDTSLRWNGIRFYDIHGDSDSSKLVNCLIEYGYPNSSGDYEKTGGGIGLVRADNVLIKSCIIRYNKTDGDRASGGAGIAAAECSPLIIQNLIHDNRALGLGHGGGIFIHKSLSEISNNIIYNNHAGGGGGITVSNVGVGNYYNPHIINNTIVYNKAEHGGGIDFLYGLAKVINNVVYFNTCINHGKQVHLGYNFNARFLYNNIEGGFEEFAHNHMNIPPPSIADYENNIDANPQFFNYPYDFTPDGYDIANTSANIEAGIDSIYLIGKWIIAPQNDFNGNERPSDGTKYPDIGALEYPWPVNTENISSEPWIESISVFPIPTSGIFQFGLDFPIDQIVRISAWDLLGKEYKLLRLSDEKFHLTGEVGTYHLIFEMKDGTKHVEKIILTR